MTGYFFRSGCLGGGKTTDRYPGLASSFVHIDYYIMVCIDGSNESRIMTLIHFSVCLHCLWHEEPFIDVLVRDMVLLYYVQVCLVAI